MAQKKFITSSLMVAGTAALVISLTGCGSNPLSDLKDKAGEAVAEKGTEKIVEGMSGGKVDVEFDSLPEGFPDDVPMVEGDILLGTKIAGEDGDRDGFILSVGVDGEPADVVEQVKDLFADWEEVTPWNDGIQSGFYSKDDWGVTISVTDGDTQADSIVGYGVIPVEE